MGPRGCSRAGGGNRSVSSHRRCAPGRSRGSGRMRRCVCRPRVSMCEATATCLARRSRLVMLAARLRRCGRAHFLGAWRATPLGKARALSVRGRRASCAGHALHDERAERERRSGELSAAPGARCGCRRTDDCSAWRAACGRLEQLSTGRAQLPEHRSKSPFRRWSTSGPGPVRSFVAPKDHRI